MDFSDKKLLIAVGSSASAVCSIGAFARMEMRALESRFKKVQLLDPSSTGIYPDFANLSQTSYDYVLFHAPSLEDRKHPWSAIANLLKIKRKFPRAKIILSVHEYTEAPVHWKIRQAALLMLSDFATANTEYDAASSRKFNRRTLYTHLGPTLFDTDFAGATENSISLESIRLKFASARERAVQLFPELKLSHEWILHPGLMTPGKGIDKLFTISKSLNSNTTLVLMGGEGPKARDKEFTKTVLYQLREKLGDRLFVISSPSDVVFQTVLTAADLVFLPYDKGVSERRSSFLSSMACGANVLTTLGEYSKPLKLEQSGVFTVDEAAWQSGDFDFTQFLKQWNLCSESERIERKALNLKWAKLRSWASRTEQLLSFLQKNS